MKNIELIPIIEAFGGLEFNPKLSISDWKHNEDRENTAKIKRARKLLQHTNKNNEGLNND